MSQHQVLFLDFDGVLHPTMPSTADGPTVNVGFFGWLHHLEKLLRPFPDVGLVVHSTWRYQYKSDELQDLLNPLGGRYLGATPRGPRFESICWWLNANPRFTSHRILDDDLAEFPSPPPSELIACDPVLGVSDERVLRELLTWLASNR